MSNRGAHAYLHFNALRLHALDERLLLSEVAHFLRTDLQASERRKDDAVRKRARIRRARGLDLLRLNRPDALDGAERRGDCRSSSKGRKERKEEYLDLHYGKNLLPSIILHSAEISISDCGK